MTEAELLHLLQPLERGIEYRVNYYHSLEEAYTEVLVLDSVRFTFNGEGEYVKVDKVEDDAKYGVTTFDGEERQVGEWNIEIGTDEGSFVIAVSTVPQSGTLTNTKLISKCGRDYYIDDATVTGCVGTMLGYHVQATFKDYRTEEQS